MVFSDYNTKFLDENGTNHLIKELKEYMSGLATGDIDLSDYYNKEEVDEKITEIKPITTDEIKALFETEGLATKEDVSAAIDSIPPTDLTNYYNKEETYNKTEVDSLVANSSGSGSSGSSTGGSSNVYSTTETAIGTWIDGSTLYRKVIEHGKLTSVSSGNYGIVYIDFDEEVSKITKMTVLLEYASTRIVVDGSFENMFMNPSTSISTYVNDVEKSKFTFIGISGKRISAYYGKNWGSYNATFIIEYTKI